MKTSKILRTLALIGLTLGFVQTVNAQIRTASEFAAWSEAMANADFSQKTKKAKKKYDWRNDPRAVKVFRPGTYTCKRGGTSYVYIFHRSGKLDYYVTGRGWEQGATGRWKSSGAKAWLYMNGQRGVESTLCGSSCGRYNHRNGNEKQVDMVCEKYKG